MRPKAVRWLGLSILVGLLAVNEIGARRNPPRVRTTTENATNPLTYKRLRYDDDALQILARFQKYLAVDERQVKFSVNETEVVDERQPRASKKLVEYSYFENEQIEAASFNYDDLVFEAIDASYLTKLVQYFVQTFDDPSEMLRASDKRVVSSSRCDKELDYLMEQLEKYERFRSDSSLKEGPRLSNAFNAELLTLLDSFGSEQPGLLLGNSIWTGNWRQCRKSQIFYRNREQPERTVDFSARYCMAALRPKRWDKLIQERVREMDQHNYFLKESQRRNYDRSHRLQIGICLPESCDTRLAWRRPKDVRRLAVHKLSEPLRSYDLYDLFCLPDNNSELRKLNTSGILFLCFIGFWFSLVALVTAYDVCTERRKQKRAATPKSTGATQKTAFDKLIDCLSLPRNLERLFETESAKPKPVVVPSRATEGSPPPKSGRSAADQPGQVAMKVDRLQFLNCLKVLISWVVIFGHIGMIFKHIDKYTLDYDPNNIFILHFNYCSAFVVEWFFVIAGFITTYTIFASRRVERNTFWSWIGVVVHRYLRLAPIFVLLFWYSRSVAKHVGEGPLWDYGTTNITIRRVCQLESLWYPLTLSPNLHPIHEECIMPSWFVGAEYQFFLATPVLLVLLHRSALLGWLVGLGVMSASIAIRFHRYWTDPRAQLLSLMKPKYDLYQRNNWDMSETYVRPQYRIGGYLCGVLAGHYTFMVLSGRWASALYRPAEHDRAPSSAAKSRPPASLGKQAGSKLHSYGALLMGFLTMLQLNFSSYFMIHYFPKELERYVDFIGSLTYAVSFVLYAAACALFITSLALGHFGALKDFMSLPFWTVLSRFNYILFIVQVEVINYYAGLASQTLEQNDSEFVKFYMYMYFVLYLISGLLTPLMEIPFGLLERSFVAPLFPPPPLPQATQKPAGESGAGSPAPARRHNALAPPEGKRAANQDYELGQVSESSRLVGGSGDRKGS